MVTKETLDFYGFNIDDYFLYIIESRENGQHKQARELYDDMSTSQKGYFWEFIDTSFFYDAQDEHLNDAEGQQSEFDKLKQYFQTKNTYQ